MRNPCDLHVLSSEGVSAPSVQIQSYLPRDLGGLQPHARCRDKNREAVGGSEKERKLVMDLGLALLQKKQENHVSCHIAMRTGGRAWHIVGLCHVPPFTMASFCSPTG